MFGEKALDREDALGGPIDDPSFVDGERNEICVVIGHVRTTRGVPIPYADAPRRTGRMLQGLPLGLGQIDLDVHGREDEELDVRPARARMKYPS